MIRFTSPAPVERGILDVHLGNPSDWFAPPYAKSDTHLGAILLGDEEVGPFAAVYSNPPRTEPTPMTPGHGHGSDSWRICLQGTMKVGATRYGPGAFRFQQGGLLYGADDSPWGPGGGYSVVMMGDRRGAGAIPANPNHQPGFAASSAKFQKWLGVNYSNQTINQGVATTLGECSNGRRDGNFGQEWPELAPGLQVAAGLVGDRESGPIVVLTNALPGRTAFPALTIASDVMHVIVRGSAVQRNDPLAAYDIRLIGENSPADALTAGPDGLWLASVIADRRGWPSAATDSRGAQLLGSMRERIEPLFEQLR